MRIQSINQNNYQNNSPKRTVAFKENFCIVQKKISGCPLESACENVVLSWRKKLATLIYECRMKAGGTKSKRIYDEKTGMIFILDENTVKKLVGAADDTSKLAILNDIKDGKTGEVINFDAQKICDEARPTEISCRGKYVSIGRKNEN